MMRNEILRRWPHASETFIRQNSDDLRPLETSFPQPAPLQTLARRVPQQKQRQGRVEIVVTFTVLLVREFDDDNLTGSLKPLRDAIAEDIGLNDADRRIKWEYGFQQTKGCPGVLVKIEKL